MMRAICGWKLGVCAVVGAAVVSLVGMGGCMRGAPERAAQASAPAGVPAVSGAQGAVVVAKQEGDAATKGASMNKTDAEWRAALTPEQYRVLREKGTERAFTGKLWDTPAGSGEYRCAACQQVLFRGTDKFVSECGWPAFDKAIKGSITYTTDRTLGMSRTEVTCSRCGGHLGHVFDDGPTETGTRYCINSVSIEYVADAPERKVETEAGGK